MTEDTSRAEGLVYQGFWKRLLALFIDTMFLIFASTYVIANFGFSETLVVIVFLIVASVAFNYYAFAEWRWGATFGKKALQMRVRTLDNRPITWNAAAIRNLLRMVDFFLVGPIMIAVTKRKQRLGDKLAKTVVVKHVDAWEQRPATQPAEQQSDTAAGA